MAEEENKPTLTALGADYVDAQVASAENIQGSAASGGAATPSDFSDFQFPSTLVKYGVSAFDDDDDEDDDDEVEDGQDHDGDLAIDESKFNKFPAEDYSIAIDQSVFEDFDSYNPELVDEYDSSGDDLNNRPNPNPARPRSTSSAGRALEPIGTYEPTRSRSLDSSLPGPSDGAQALYQKAQQRVTNPTPQIRSRASSRLDGSGPVPAVRINTKTGDPGPNRMGKDVQPKSCGVKRATSLFGRSIKPSYVPPVSSPFNPNPSVLPLSSLEPGVTSTVDPTMEPVSPLQYGPSTSKGPRKGTHQRSSAVSHPAGDVIFPAIPYTLPGSFKMPATPEELEELTGMDRETGLAAGAELAIARQKKEDAARFLKVQRSFLKFETEAENIKRADAGQPLVPGSDRIPEIREERAQFTRALLHEYHERYTTMRQQWHERRLVEKRLEQTQAELFQMTSKRDSLQEALTSVEEELDDTFELQHSKQTEQNTKFQRLQNEYSKLKEEALALQGQYYSASGAVQSLEKTLAEQSAEVDALKLRCTELERSNELLRRSRHMSPAPEEESDAAADADAAVKKKGESSARQQQHHQFYNSPFWLAESSRRQKILLDLEIRQAEMQRAREEAWEVLLSRT